MKVTPRWSSCSATRSLSSTVRERPSCWLPSRRIVSKMSTASGSSGTAKSCAWAVWPCAWECRAPPWLWASPPASVDMVQPFLVLVDLAPDRGEVHLLDLLGDAARVPGPDGTVVDGTDRHHLGRGPREEGLVGQVEVSADDGLVTDLVAEIAGDRLDGVLRDAVERAGIRCRRREENAVAHDEDVLAGALAHVTVGGEQDGLVVAGVERLHLGQGGVGVHPGPLGRRRHRVGVVAPPRADFAGDAVGDALISEVCPPGPGGHGHVDRAGQRVEAHFAVPQVDEGTEVAAVVQPVDAHDRA